MMDEEELENILDRILDLIKELDERVSNLEGLVRK